MVEDKTTVTKNNNDNKILDEKAAKEAKKKTFQERTKTGFLYIFSWLVVYFVFNYLTSSVWTFGNISQNVRIGFNFINLILLVPVLFFGIKEICDLCFKGDKKIFLSFTITTFIFYVTLGIILLLSMPNRFGIIPKALSGSNTTYKAFKIYAAVFLGILVILLISCFTLCAVKAKKHLLSDKKTMITFPGMIFFVTLYACAFFYVSSAHQWTTALALAALPIFADMFAYIVGIWIGKHKMCPKISPKKTWEGLIGSIVITTLLMCALYAFFFIPNAESKFNSLYSFLGCQTCIKEAGGKLINLKPYFWAIYVCATIVLIFVSTAGDLFYSWIKRRYKIKDFSNLLPGHGGMLDRIDSSTFVFVFYFIITIILQLAVKNSGSINVGVTFLWTL